MRNAAVLVMLLAAACASPTAMIDERHLECGPGEAISVQAGLNRPGMAMEGTPDYLTLLVEVSNNSQAEVTVTRIQARQVSGGDRPVAYSLENVSRQFDVTIEEGKDHVFEIPVVGRPGNGAFTDPRSPRASGNRRGGVDLLLVVTVSLSNGDSYACRFVVGAPA